MNINILEMPAEGVYKVNLDGLTVAGYIRRVLVGKKEGHWEVFVVQPTGVRDRLRTTPQSREAAAMLLLYHHFTRERQSIREAGDARALAEGDEMSGQPTSGQPTA